MHVSGSSLVSGEGTSGWVPTLASRVLQTWTFLFRLFKHHDFALLLDSILKTGETSSSIPSLSVCFGRLGHPAFVLFDPSLPSDKHLAA